MSIFSVSTVYGESLAVSPICTHFLDLPDIINVLQITVFTESIGTENLNSVDQDRYSRMWHLIAIYIVCPS